MLSPNTLLNSRYQIIRQIGAGGMGAVYLAQHVGLSQYVAVKENFSNDASAAAQFQTEAKILAALAHPNLPRVTDFFVEPNGARYLVMEHIAGQNLDEIVAQRGALTEAETLAWMAQIFNAVDYLHQNHIIHRDIKPQNIILTPQGRVMLVDFGIAKHMQPGFATLSGARAATPGFAAPEQYRGGTDQRSDVYSLGALLYAMLTAGAPPDALAFERGTAMLVSPRHINSMVSQNVEQSILRAMSLNAAQRFESVGAMQQALLGIQSQFTSRQTAQSFQPTPATLPQIMRPLNLSVLMGIVALIALIAVLSVGVFVVANMQIETPPVTLVAVVSTVTPTATPTQIASPVTMILPSATRTGLPAIAPTLTVTPTRTRTATSAPQPTRTATPTRPAPTTLAPVAQKKFDSDKDGTFIVEITSGARTKLQLIGGVSASAVWSPNGDRALISWLKTGTVKKDNGTFTCGYSWQWDSYRGYFYGPNYCKNPPSFFSGTYGGGLRLITRNGDMIADLVTGSAEPHFVGDPQVNYTDALWSPDGRRLVVLYKQADGNRCPFIGNADATGLRKLTNCEADDHPRFWSVDGKWVITWSEREPQLYAYEVDGNRRVALDQLGKLQVYDQRYFPWRVTDQPICKGDTGFWSCQ
jgi:serine/threonine protein kinase